MRFDSLNKTRKRKIDTRSFPWIIDEKHRGTIGLLTTSVVMNRTVDAKLHRSKVTYFITENPALFAGNNTVAIFRIKSFTDQFKAFFNQTHIDMHMDPNAQTAETEQKEVVEEVAQTQDEATEVAQETGDAVAAE